MSVRAGTQVLRRLRDLRRERSRRDREQVFVAEGIHLAREALEAGADVEMAVFSPELEENPEGRWILDRARARGVPRRVVSRAVIDGLQDARSPQPVLLVVRRPRAELDGMLGGRPGTPLIVAPCGIQDPGNLGALLRTADAAGATSFVALGAGVDLYHPRSVRATMGSIFRLPSAVTLDVARAVEALRGRGLVLVAADRAGSLVYDERDYRGPVAIFLGSEGAGLPGDLHARMDETVRIPLEPGVESLSVGAAAAVVLFEAARQRRRSEAPVSYVR